MIYGVTLSDILMSIGFIVCVVMIVPAIVKHNASQVRLRAVEKSIEERKALQARDRLQRFMDARDRAIPWETPQDNGLDLTMLEVYHEPTIDQPGTEPVK